MRVLPVCALLLTASYASLITPATATGAEALVAVAFNGPIPLDVDARLAERGATLERRDDLLNFVLARTTDPSRLRSWNMTDPYIRFAEIPGTLTPFDATTASADTTPPDAIGDYPNDPLHWRVQDNINYQWALRASDVRQAWNQTPGDGNVLIAVVDTGVDYTHPDLAGNIARNPDGTVRGIDLLASDTDPMDHTGHGTLLAGIIAAQTNNARGIAGVAHVKIMPVRVLDGGPKTHGSALAASGIAWSAAHGARIITAAMKAEGEDLTLQLGIEYARSLGALVIAPVGNTNGGAVTRPATYPGVLAVTALGHSGTAPPYASIGPEIDLAAPGGTGDPRDVDDVLSLGLEGSYRFAWGTSYAVGFVAGTAGLVLSARPVLTASQVREALEESAVDLGPVGRDSVYGAGRLSAVRAVERALLIPTQTQGQISGEL